MSCGGLNNIKHTSMARKKGSLNKPKTEQTKPAVSTRMELDILAELCARFELLNEDQRIRTAFFLTHKYPEYFPLTNKK